MTFPEYLFFPPDVPDILNAMEDYALPFRE